MLALGKPLRLNISVISRGYSTRVQTRCHVIWICIRKVSARSTLRTLFAHLRRSQLITAWTGLQTIIMPLTLQAQLSLSGVILLIGFLGYGSQICFHLIDPSPLGPAEALIFNTSLACIWICYFRACFTNPGHVAADWNRKAAAEGGGGGDLSMNNHVQVHRQRWCRRCEIWKPPRAHHCKTCQR